MITEKPERLFESANHPATPRRGSETRHTYDDRLNHILEAATGVIAQVGYEKASMRAVAKAAGVSLAGLYHYFEGKENMLFLIQFRTFSSLLNNLREKVHGVDVPVDQLRVMVRVHVGYFAANMAALKVCSHELDSLTGAAHEEARRIRREYYELTRSIVAGVLNARGSSGPLDEHLATMSLFGTLNWLYRWYNPKRGPSPAVVAGQIAAQFLYGVLGTSNSDDSGTGPRKPLARGDVCAG